VACCSVEDVAPPDLIVAAVIGTRDCLGIEAGAKALSRWPKVKFLLTSASPASVWPAGSDELLRLLPQQSYRFLPKAFTAQQVTLALEELFSPQE
jgi:hypothetical protein